MSEVFEAPSPFDSAYGGRDVQMIGRTGAEALEVGGWSGEPDLIDHALFLDHCDGPTLDVGCGPGRLVGHLSERGVAAMGIDVSFEAVRQTRDRGANAWRGDVFGPVPDEGRWAYVLLADGNVGIGGDPARLLIRLGEVMTPDGRAIVEVAPAGTGFVRDRRRLRIDGVLSAPFDWALVGLDAIGAVAREAGFVVQGIRTLGARHAATLVRAPA
ncbi:MAG: SAM-dependent methyltransferase [Aeromicrobium sp.]|nr:SAM-dependent methyltransferase [Aeromicrobium sp.]